MQFHFLDPLFEAIAWILINIHAGLGHIFDPDSGAAWGLAIVTLTVAVRLVIFPLFVKQIRSAHKMQQLQPKVAELRKKYKNDKQRLNQEMVKLYQENGANPLGGCLPLVVQAPFFFGLYRVLRAISEPNRFHVSNVTHSVVESAQHAKIFGAPIYAHFFQGAPGHFFTLSPMGSNPIASRAVIFVIVLLSACTTFLTVRQSTRRAMNQPGASENPMARQQKFMMYVAPFFALYGLVIPIGVMLYWFTTNIWTLGQQHFIYSKMVKAETEGEGTASTDESKQPASSGPKGLLAGLRKNKASDAVAQGDNGETATKIVRNQPTRQSRSKRMGKKT